MDQRLAVLLLGLSLWLLLAGCVRPDQRPAGSNASPAAKTGLSNGSGSTLTLRLPRDPWPLRPYLDRGESTELLFAGLVRLDHLYRPQLDLADEWTVAPGGTAWTFRLRPGLRWHDGHPLTAQDVAFTYRAIQATSLPVPSHVAAEVEDVSALDDRRVRLALRRPFAPLLADLAQPILPSHLLAREPGPLATPLTIGSGPFRLVERRPDGELLLGPHMDYHTGQPQIDQVRLRVLPGAEETLSAFRAGQVHLAAIDRRPDGPALGRGQAAPLRGPGYTFVGLNVRPGRLFADPTVRLAWALALDQGEVVRIATAGQSEPVRSHILPTSWAYEAAALPGADRARARRLLDQAGWVDPGEGATRQKQGQPLAVDLLVRQDSPERTRAAEAMARQLLEVGFSVRVTPLDFATGLTARRRPPFDFDAMIAAWALPPDPDDYPLLASGQEPSVERPELANFVGFRNPRFDRLSQEARTTLGVERRAELYRQTQRLVGEELPYLPLWADTTYLLVSDRLRGLGPLTSDRYLWNVARWRLE